MRAYSLHCLDVSTLKDHGAIMILDSRASVPSDESAYRYRSQFSSSLSVLMEGMVNRLPDRNQDMSNGMYMDETI